MENQLKFVSLCILGITAPLYGGCRDNSPPTPRVPPPQAGYDTASRSYEPNKPNPPPAGDPTMQPLPFSDPPLLIDQPPEAKRFVEVYKQVGRPRIAVFVNRSLQGEVLPNVQEHNETAVKAGTIDYAMMEALLSNWMSADNQVTIMSPATVRRMLTDQQVRELEAGKAPLTEVGRQLDADVLIQLQSRPTKQTLYGSEFRLVADAINLRGGESLARVTVDVPPPIDKPQANKFTRFIARNLMDGMSNTWSVPAPAKP